MTDPIHSRNGSSDHSPSDSLAIYLRQIGEVRLITPEEEVALATQIKNGDAGARELFIVSNLRLVVKIALDYKDFGLPLLDLINEGNIGLIKAVERFDPYRGAKFSTYASFWIKQYIIIAISKQTRTIRLPIHVIRRILAMNESSHQLAEKLGRSPTDEELAFHLNVKVDYIEQLRAVDMKTISIHSPQGQNGYTTTLIDHIEDTSTRATSTQVEVQSDLEYLSILLGQLSAIQRKVIIFRFGLNGEEAMTLDEVGLKINMTSERARQIQERALEILHKLMFKSPIANMYYRKECPQNT